MNKKNFSFLLLFLVCYFYFPAFSSDSEWYVQNQRSLRQVIINENLNHLTHHDPSVPLISLPSIQPWEYTYPQYIDIGYTVGNNGDLIPISVSPWALNPPQGETPIIEVDPYGFQGYHQIGINELRIPIWMHSASYHAMQNGSLPSIFNPTYISILQLAQASASQPLRQQSFLTPNAISMNLQTREEFTPVSTGDQALHLMRQGSYEKATTLLIQAIDTRQDSPGNVLLFRLAQMVANQYTNVMNDECAFQLLENLRNHPQTDDSIRDYCLYYQVKMYNEGRAVCQTTLPLNDNISIARLYLIKDKVGLDENFKIKVIELLNNLLHKS